MAEARVVSSDEDVAQVLAEDRASGRRPPTFDDGPKLDRSATTDEDGPKDWGAAGQVNRDRIRAELNAKPWLHERFAQMIRGEVGNRASPEVRRIQMESAANRALSRGHSLEQVLLTTHRLGDAGYYPSTTYSRGAYDQGQYRDDLEAVLSGSNYGGKYMPEGHLHTGNASGIVAAHQFRRQTPGFTLQTGSGPESYFNEDQAMLVDGKVVGRAFAKGTRSQQSDYTNRLNTTLTPQQQAQFDQWASANKINVNAEKHDYDIQGAWLNGALTPGGHGSDRFKKPNHMTFSDESQYNGVDGRYGGHWSGSATNGWSFEPSQHNLDQHSAVQMQGYFDHVEKPNNAKLKLPEPKQAGLLDWFRGPAPVVAKGTPPQAADPIKEMIGQTAPREWPTEEEAKFQAQYNPPGQTGETARVLGQMRSYKTKGGKTVTSFEPGEITNLKGLREAAMTGEDPTKSQTLNLGDHPAVAKLVQPMVQQAARASTRSALATLGFNPGRTAIEVSGNRYNVGGLTDPEGTAPMWVNASSPSAMVHESIHRGIYMLTKSERTKDEANKILKKLDDYKPFKVGKQDSEELVVRQIMRTVMGGIESKDPRADVEQIGAAKAMFEDGVHAMEASRLIHRLEQMAAESVGRRGGPH